MKNFTLTIWLTILCTSLSFANNDNSNEVIKKGNEVHKTYPDYSPKKTTQNTVNSPNCSAPVPNVTSLPDITAQCSVTLTAPTATSDCYGEITGTTINPLTYNE